MRWDNHLDTRGSPSRRLSRSIRDINESRILNYLGKSGVELSTGRLIHRNRKTSTFCLRVHYSITLDRFKDLGPSLPSTTWVQKPRSRVRHRNLHSQLGSSLGPWKTKVKSCHWLTPSVFDETPPPPKRLWVQIPTVVTKDPVKAILYEKRGHDKKT